MLSISKTILKLQHEDPSKGILKLGVINGQRGEFHLPLHKVKMGQAGGPSNNHWK